MNNSAVKDSHVAEDRKLGNMLKRGREKVKEVAEKGRSVRARVKVKWRQWLRLGRLWDSKGGNDCGKRKRDESGSGGGVIAKKRCFNQ